MGYEAQKKKLVYLKVDPDNTQQIEDASFCEREGFGTGLDPQELPPVLKWLAKNGTIYLQYAVEDRKRVPTGVMEFISLAEAVKFRPEDLDAKGFELEKSPLAIIMAGQSRIFADARRFAQSDEDVIYCHGIAMARKGKGYGSLLEDFAFENLPGASKSVFAAFIDAAKLGEDGVPELAPNEDSFRISIKKGFVLTGVLQPPVYDQNLVYYSFIRPVKPIDFSKGAQININLAEGDPESVLNVVSRLTKEGFFVGRHYNKETHAMEFSDLAQH